MTNSVPLGELRPGQRARLAPPPPGKEVGRRLEDLGFVPGTAITVIRHAPLGDPVEVELRGYRLCLRAAQLAGLRVVVEEGQS